MSGHEHYFYAIVFHGIFPNYFQIYLLSILLFDSCRFFLPGGPPFFRILLLHESKYVDRYPPIYITMLPLKRR